MSNKTVSNVWKFFTKDDDKTATCSLCLKRIKSSGRVFEFYSILKSSFLFTIRLCVLFNLSLCNPGGCLKRNL